MKIDFKYEIIKSDLPPYTQFHDDMLGSEVKIKEFPFMNLFDDFRIFNLISLRDMDDLLVRISDAMIDVEHLHNLRNPSQNNLQGESSE